MKSRQADPVREWLRSRGCPAHIVRAGVPGLVDRWDEIAHSLEDGYPYTLDDYLNDMDTRTVLEGALDHLGTDEAADARASMASADRLFRQLTESLDHCLWGDDVAEHEGWDRDREWWYWRRPRDPGPDFSSDLAEAELE